MGFENNYRGGTEHKADYNVNKSDITASSNAGSILTTNEVKDINYSSDATASSFASPKLLPPKEENNFSLDSIPDDHYDDVPLADKN